jgi:hypothetical protein
MAGRAVDSVAHTGSSRRSGPFQLLSGRWVAELRQIELALVQRVAVDAIADDRGQDFRSYSR